MSKQDEKVAAYLCDVSYDLANYLAYRIKNDINDIIGDISLLALMNANKLAAKSYEEFCYWVFNVARKKVYEWYRKERKKPEFLSDRMLSDEFNPLEEYLLKEEREALIKVLLTLKSKDKDLLVLRFVEGYTFKQISEMLGVGINTLITRNRRLLEKIKILMSEKNR